MKQKKIERQDKRGLKERDLRFVSKRIRIETEAATRPCEGGGYQWQHKTSDVCSVDAAGSDDRYLSEAVAFHISVVECAEDFGDIDRLVDWDVGISEFGVGSVVR